MSTVVYSCQTYYKSTFYIWRYNSCLSRFNTLYSVYRQFYYTLIRTNWLEDTLVLNFFRSVDAVFSPLSSPNFEDFKMNVLFSFAFWNSAHFIREYCPSKLRVLRSNTECKVGTNCKIEKDTKLDSAFKHQL